MLHITADLYSGRTNPSWLATNDDDIRIALRDLAKNRAAVTAQSPSQGLLGELRGFHVQVQSDELALDHDLPSSLYVPLDQGTGPLAELAERFIGMASQEGMAAAAQGDGESPQALDLSVLQGLLHRKLVRQTGISSPDGKGEPCDGGCGGEAQAEGEEGDAAAAAIPTVTCTIELGAYNPGFWNNNAQILRNNNCYNYASNKRTDTFAQPGRGSGQIYSAITCAAVSQAAMRDGLHRRFVCFPPAEAPRYLVALVVAPGPGFVDFHWYRKNKEGFWSHKPGGTAARNVDNSGRLISDPANCDRGPYTQFCGYFYTCRSQRIR